MYQNIPRKSTPQYYYIIRLGTLFAVRARNKVHANIKLNQQLKGAHKHESYHCLSL